MKRLFSLIIVAMAFVLLVSCGDNGQDSNSLDIEASDNLSDAYSLDLEKSEEAEERDKWEDFPEYTLGIPKPIFVADSPLIVNVASESILTFSALEGTEREELTEYLLELEKLGFVCKTDSNTPDLFSGKVYSDNVPVLEYTYRYGRIFLDVFKNSINSK